MATATKKPAAKKAAAKPARKKSGAKKPLVGDAVLDALRAAVWANPEDTQAIAIYADKLMELGDPRGEYIQLRLIDELTDAQTARREQLFEKHRTEWIRPARPFGGYDRHTFDRACFLTEIEVSVQTVIESFAAVRSLGPRMLVHLPGMRKQKRATEAALAKLPLGSLFALHLGSNALDDKSLATLAPALQGIRGLHLSHNEITSVGYRALAKHVTTLEFLQVGAAANVGDRVAMIDGIVDALTENPSAFAALRYLYFYRTKRPTAAAFAKLKKLPGLSRIRVGDYTEWQGNNPTHWKPEPSDLTS